MITIWMTKECCFLINLSFIGGGGVVIIIRIAAGGGGGEHTWADGDDIVDTW